MQDQTIPTNSALAGQLAEVADALAGFDHLPPVNHVFAFRGGVFRIGMGYRRDARRDLATWAATFDTPVVIDLSSTGELFTVIPLGSRQARIQMSIDHREAYELGAALQVPVSPGGQVEVSADALLAVLAEPAGKAGKAGA